MINWLKAKLTSIEVAEIIRNFLEDKGDPYEWGDFLCISIQDKNLDEIRRQCNALSERYPAVQSGQFCNDEGIRELKNILNSLQEKHV